MKWLSLLLLISTSVLAATPTYESAQKDAEAHQKTLEIEGLGYMIGGGLGLASSLTLGITSEEVVPKLGYSLMQTLSSAAIAYGGIIYFIGDDTTHEAQKLRDFANILNKQTNLTPAQKQKVLNDATAAFAARAEQHRYRVRKIRGALELTTAAAAAATLAFSKTSGSSTNVSLGFILLISLTGGISDLLGAHEPTTPVSASLDFARDAPRFAIKYQW